MRIAFLTHQFPGVRMGGLGSYTVAAARALAAAGHEVHIFTFPVPAEVRQHLAAECPGVTLREIPDLATRVANGAAPAETAAAVQAGGEAAYRLAMGAILGDALLEMHRSMPFDIVEAPECEGLSVPLMLSLRRPEYKAARLAVITHIHSGTAVSRRGNQQPSTTADLAIDALEAAAIVLADEVVAMTQAVVRETTEALGVNRRAELIPLAIPSEPEYLPPPAEGPILFVGRLERLKGVDVLVRAAGTFLARCPDAHLRFVGPDTVTAPEMGPGGEKSMRAWMLRHLPAEVKGRVEFTGELPPSQVTEQMRQAIFLVLPSVVENFSLVAAQAMGLGRTAIFSSGIGTAEMYGECGVSFEKGNVEALAAAMESLWRDRGQTEQLSTAAWKRAREQFNAASIARRHTAFYERALQNVVSGRRDLSGMPPHLAGALLEPLMLTAQFACGIQEGPVTPGRRLRTIMDRLAEESGNAHVRVLLYGAGRHSSRLMTEKHVWEGAGHEVVGFIDDGKRWAVERVHLGLPVMSRQEVQEKLGAGESVLPIVLSTDTFEDQFWEQTRELRERGVRVFRLYGVSTSSE